MTGHCYQHPGRIAGAPCLRCRRPICPECMQEVPDQPGDWRCANCEPARRPTAALGTSRLSPVVTAIIALNVVIFLATAHDQAGIDNRFDMIPVAVAEGQWYRLLTAAFLHLNASHIFFNMVTLAIIGPAVENAVGRVRFVALYVLAAAGGSIASYLLSPFLTAAVGASGAIFGVMGAYLVLARRSGIDTRTVLALIGVNLLIGFAEAGIDWRAHLGGLATGIAVAYGFSRAGELRRQAAQRGAVLTVAAVAAVLVVVAQLPAGHVNL